jgi:hypothetical protein
MINPRDALPRFGIPVDYETGQPLSDMQMVHLTKIREAADLLYAAMHDAEGSGMPGLMEDHVFQTRRMALANTHLENALLWARKAVLS